MADVFIRSFAGTSADPAAWPKSLRGGVVERAPALFARNLTWAHGAPQGRPGQISLYPPLGGGALSTGCNGPVEVFWHTTRPGCDYQIVAGYKFTLGGGGDGTGTIAFVVTVYADRQKLTSATYDLDALSYKEIPRLPPIHGISFGASFIITGPGVRANPASPIGFLEVKFTRRGPTIGEAELFDRDIVSFASGDDDGPYSSRVERGVAICVFQSRIVLAVPGGLIYSNPADIGGWPANNFIPTPGEDVVALGASDRYLICYTRGGGGFILRGGLTGIDDTSRDVISGLPSCVSHRGLVVTPEAQVVISDDGIFACRADAAPVLISDGIAPILAGDGPQIHAFDWSRYMPVRDSLVNAPAAWLPTRRELHIALSSGRVGAQPWVGAGGDPIDGYGYAMPRDLRLVAYIPPGAFRKPALISWAWETSDDPAQPKTAEALCGYKDADGFDVLLSTSHRGRVFMGLVGDTDEIETDDRVKLNEPSVTAVVLYGSDLALAPIMLPTPGRSRVQKIDVAFAESFIVADGSLCVDVAVGPEGATDGDVVTAELIGQDGVLAWGDPLPATVATTPSTHRAPTLMGAAGADAVSVRIRSVGRPAPTLRGATLRVQAMERMA